MRDDTKNYKYLGNIYDRLDTNIESTEESNEDDDIKRELEIKEQNDKIKAVISNKLNIPNFITNINYNIYNKKYCDDFHIESLNKIEILKSNCGTGKTRAICNHIKQLHNKDNKLSILIVCSRRTFSTSFLEVVNTLSSLFKFDNYLDLKDNIEITSKLCINSAESLYKLKNAYDFIFSDEITSFLDQLILSPFHSNSIYLNRNIYEQNIIHSKSSIFCDADVDYRLFKYINFLLPTQPINFSYNTYLTNSSDTYYQLYIYEMFESLKKDLLNGKKIQIVISNKNFGLLLYKYILTECNILENKIIYHYNEGDEYLNVIQNVNYYWPLYDVLMYTSKIGSGIDFSAVHFDKCYVFADSCSVCVRILNQMIHRVRHLKENTIYLNIVSKKINLPITKPKILAQLNENVINTINLDLYAKNNFFTKNNLIVKVEQVYDPIENRINKKFIKTFDDKDIYVDLALDFLLESNLSKNNFTYEFIGNCFKNGNIVKPLGKFNEEKNKIALKWISENKKLIKDNKILTIQQLSNTIFSSYNTDLSERVLIGNTTKEDKLEMKIQALIKQFRDPNSINLQKDADLINFNLEQHERIFNYRYMLECSESEWIADELTIFNEFAINKDLKAYKLYVIKYVTKKLTLNNINDFNTEIPISIILELIPFFKENFNKFVSVFGLQTEKIPSDLETTTTFINSLFLNIGLSITKIRRTKNKIKFSVYKLHFKNELYEKSSILYSPIGEIKDHTIDEIYNTSLL